jgi:probable rRNA maturation factor
MSQQSLIHTRLDISGEEYCSLQYSFFEDVCSKTLILSRFFRSFEGKVIHVALTFVSPSQMADINWQYRENPKETDILSFPTYATKEDIVRESGKEIFLGELFVCQKVIQKDAKKDGVSLNREMAFVFSHGILHLLGYEHSEEMFALQDKICETGVERIDT